MANFQERIEDMIGAVASVGSDDISANEQAIQDALQDTAKDIINKVRPDIFIQFATKSSNVTSNPIVPILRFY
jgi:NADH pyrophosphatase NudC (nudix superfamily)